MHQMYDTHACGLIAVQVDVPRYRAGDAVRVMDDLAEVAKLQKNHGGWVEEMSDVRECSHFRITGRYTYAQWALLLPHPLCT